MSAYDIGTAREIMTERLTERITDAAAGAAVASPWWLPWLASVSEIAAHLVPIAGFVWLCVQIYCRVRHKA